MDRIEALNIFIRSNLKLLLSKKFNNKLFKKAKRDYFLGGHKRVGVPKNQEIAEQAINFLIRNGVISDDNKLAEIFSLPFFTKYVYNKEAFSDLLEMEKSMIVVVDRKKLAEASFRDQLKKELKEEVIEEKTREIEEAIRRKKEEYRSIPSILDVTEFEEPTIEKEPESEKGFMPWWEHLNLSADPFPTQEGLFKIADELHEKVVFKTPIFEKYTFLTKNSPKELFKNAIIFGEFGSGKTTLFDYLRKPFINSKIFAIYVQLYAESSFHSLLEKFRKKLFEGLCEMHELLYEFSPEGLLKSSNFQENITSLIKKFTADENVLGIIVIIDDLHKNIDEFDIAMKFITNLQIFKMELLRKIPEINIGFYVAGSSDWERIIKNDPKFSGSYIRHETMPPITVEAAYEMLNKRLSAFALNPESIKTIDIGFVERIYRGLQNNSLPITFRSFIRATLDQFERNKFDILTVDPVHISKETLAEIRETLQWNQILKKRFDNLLYGGGILKEENRKKTLDLLVNIYLQNGIVEDSEVFKDNIFSFQRLERSGLIQKALSASGLKWVICKELDEINKKIVNNYNLSMEDYLTKIYISPLSRVRAKKIEKKSEENKVLELLIDSLTNREARKLLKQSKDIHTKIISDMERHERKAKSADVIFECVKSLALFTKAIARFLGLEVAHKEDLALLKDFWKDFWFSPGAVSEFINKAQGFSQLEENSRIWYSCLIYRESYTALLNFFKEEVDKSRYMMIPLADLSNEEIERFHEIRTLWSKNQYFEVGKVTAQFMENKLRSFLFNLFSLLYGSQQKRLENLDKTTREYIKKNIEDDLKSGLNVSKNEFEQVNRGNYKNFLIGSYDKNVGQRNWKNVFRKVFSPLTENGVKEFLDTFALFNIATSHQKQFALGAQQQSRILSYILSAIDITKKINQTYVSLIDNQKNYFHIQETHGPKRTEHYFSLNNMEDKKFLTPIQIKPTIANRIADQLKRLDSLSINLEDYQYIESYFSIAYREFMTILARTIAQLPIEAKKTGLRVTIKESKGSTVTLNITKM